MKSSVIRLLAVCSAVCLSGALLSGCDTGASRDPEQGFKNYVTAVAKAPQDGYTAYWLGRAFEAGGLTFKGPDVPDFGAEVAAGGVQMSYNAKVNGGGVGMIITLYSEAAWQRIGGGTKPLPKNTISKAVVVSGVTAELHLIPAGTRPVNDAQLDMRLGNTMVEAVAEAGGPAAPGGPESNPLIDEQTFLSVMQQLRPYPQ